MVVDDIFNNIYKLKNTGKYDEALLLLLNKRTGRIKKPFSVDLNHAWYVVGDIFYEKKKYLKAAHAFKRALASWADDIDALWALANCYSEMSSPRYAKYYLVKAIRLDGGRDEFRFNLANALFDMGKYREAIGQYKRLRNKSSNLFKLAKANIKCAENEIAKRK